MFIQHQKAIDKVVCVTVKQDGTPFSDAAQEPIYTMVTLGYMSYIVGGNVSSNTPAQVHMLVGNYCQIAHNTTFAIGMNHAFSGVTAYPFDSIWGVSKESIQRRSLANRQQLIIGHDVWIGFGVTIIKGVKIGNGAIIGSGSVVTKDVPPYAIVGGNPAKVIRYRFAPEIIKALDKIKWWYWPQEKINANRQYMDNVEDFVARFGEKNAKVENTAVSNTANGDNLKINQTQVPPHVLKKFQACHQAGGKIFYFVPDLASSKEDARWPFVLSQFCQKFDSQQHCLILAFREKIDYEAQIQTLQKFMAQFPQQPEFVAAVSSDGITLELLEQADYFITTRDAISSKGIDYVETFGGHVLSGMEYDIFGKV